MAMQDPRLSRRRILYRPPEESRFHSLDRSNLYNHERRDVGILFLIKYTKGTAIQEPSLTMIWVDISIEILPCEFRKQIPATQIHSHRRSYKDGKGRKVGCLASRLASRDL
jgi:hypothetical protein